MSKITINEIGSSVIQYFKNIIKSYQKTTVRVHFIKRAENKSDCILIESEKKNILIDAGWEKNSINLANYLEVNNITKIAVIMLRDSLPFKNRMTNVYL